MTIVSPALAAAIVAAAALVVTPAAAVEPAFPQASDAPSEKIGPAATGKPKPFRVVAQTECEMSTCIASFGKKGDKVRTVEWLSCGVQTEGGILLLGSPMLNDISDPVGFMATVSRAMEGTAEIAIAEFDNVFEVPAGDVLLVRLATNGTPVGAQCMAAGTIR